MTERADMETLRRRLGAVSTVDDGRLSAHLDASRAWVYGRVFVADRQAPEVVEAILLMASRLNARRRSPEGVAGWDDMGAIRIIARDPDVRELLEQHINPRLALGIG